jgi:DNA topoisomerase IB
VWREVKRLGALYLHDGVAVLPDTAATRAGFERLAERIEALDGQATLIWEARISSPTAAALLDELARARRAEYAEVETALAALDEHVGREALHRHFSRQELVGLAKDLSRLERWLEQVAARDYLGDSDGTQAAAALVKCRAALARQAVSLSPSA